MGFGLSFGANKKTTNLVTDIDKLESGSQTGNTTTTGTTTGSQTGSQTGTSSSQGSSSTTGTQSQSGTTTTTGQTTGSSNSFSGGLAADIESSINDLLGGVRESGQYLGGEISKLGNFNPDQFVKGILDQANAKQNTNLDESINGLVSGSGGRIQDNSMSALLANRLTGDAAANIAGITSQATAAGQGILQENLGAAAGAMSSVNNLAPAIINALKGGNVNTTQTNLAQEIANLVGQTTGSTNTSESGQTGQTSNQTTSETTNQTVAQLLETLMHTIGTETSKGTEKKVGGGMSLGF